MKRIRILSMAVCVCLFLFGFPKVNVRAENIADMNENENISVRYKFNLETRSLQVVEGEILEQSEAMIADTFVTEDGEAVSSYVPEGLSVDPPPEYNPTHYLGSWNAISPATGGQYRNTVFLNIVDSNGKSYRGTGFMIGPAAVATAAHCLYNTSYSGDNFAETITVIPARSNSSYPYGTATASSVMVDSRWINNKNYDYDWGIIELNSNIGDSVGWLGLKYQNSSYNGTNIKINGYPKYLNEEDEEDGNECFIMQRTDGSIYYSETYKLRSKDTNTFGGMSGSPVYIYSSSLGYTAIAIHSTAATSGNVKYNRFTRITQDLYNDFLAYRNVRV